MISDCGDVVEQCEIARKVARKLANRYREQLVRLHGENEKIDGGCCSCLKLLPFIDSDDDDPPAARVATFAINYIISAIPDQSITKLKFKHGNKQDSLVQLLVELACSARGPSITLPKCIHDDPNQRLPLAPKLKPVLQHQQQLISSSRNQVRHSQENAN
ncbi:unnamed protein product [Rotaria sp. Silwood1]|nr:unnamed protein product [Rotaria sp. Silwood1]